MKKRFTRIGLSLALCISFQTAAPAQSHNVAVEFATSTFGVIESAGTASIALHRVGDSSTPFTVDFSTTTNGTAVAGTDYLPQSVTIAFNAGETNKSVSVTVRDDFVVNGDRTVQLLLSNPTGGATLGAQQTAVLTIQDNEIAPASLLDLSFNPGTGITGEEYDPPIVNGMAVLSDDKIVVCGFFRQVAGLNEPGLVRFNADGSVDPTFAVNGQYWDHLFFGGLIARADGHLLLGSRGEIFDYDPQGQLVATWPSAMTFDGHEIEVSSLVVQTNGMVLAAGRSTGYQAEVVRLQPTGQLDTNFTRATIGGTNFNPALLNSIAMQQDGRILIAGRFSTVNGVSRSCVARLNSDGSFDQGFNAQIGPDFDGLNAVALQPDGKVLLGGPNFTIGNKQQVNLARFNSDGSLDQSFQSRLLGYVYSIVVQPDGRVLVVAAGSVIRLNQDGTTDESFAGVTASSNPYGTARPAFVSLGFQSSGEIMMAGDFDVVSGVPRAGIARLYPDNEHPVRLQFADGSPRVSEDAGIAVVAVERVGESSQTLTAHYATSDGSAIAGLDYTPTDGVLTFLPGQNLTNIVVPVRNDSLPEAPRTVNLTLSQLSGPAILGDVTNAVLTINDNDYLTLDQAAYDVNENDGDVIISVQRHGDTQIPLIVSYFTTDGVPGCPRCGQTAVAGVDYQATFGALNFDVGETNKTFTIPIIDNALPNGDRVFTATVFFGYQVQVTIHDNEAPAILDGGFNTGNGFQPPQYIRYGAAYEGINCVAVQSDGKILVGGIFDTVEGHGQTNLARLLPGGVVDTGFVASTGSTNASGNFAQVTVLAVQADGRIIVAGDFTSCSGHSQAGLARLKADGTLDPTFEFFRGVSLTNPLTDQNGNAISSMIIRAVVVEPAGTLIIGGTFDTVNGVGRTNLARLNPDGSLNTNFIAGTESAFAWFDLSGNAFTNPASVSALALQLDGSILVGGTFTMLNGTEHTSIGRLKQDGSLDSSFFTGRGVELEDNPGTVGAIFVQPEGYIVFNGQFSSVHGEARPGVARLNGDGSLDTSFRPAETLPVDAIAPTTNDFVLVAEHLTVPWEIGYFYKFVLRRMNPDGSPDSSFVCLTNSGAGRITAMIVQSDGAVLIAGGFWQINGEAHFGLARIYANPSEPVVEFALTQDPNTGMSSRDVAINEDTGFATLSVQRLGDSSSSFAVDYATANGSAIADVNYVSTNGTLVFAPLQTLKRLVIPILDDHLVQADLQFQIKLSNPRHTSGVGAAPLLGASTANITIHNTDPGFPPDGIVVLPDGQLSLTISAPASVQFVLEASTNLHTWIPLSTNVSNFIDIRDPTVRERFYRLRMLDP